jgi:hypothetical protein
MASGASAANETPNNELISDKRLSEDCMILLDFPGRLLSSFSVSFLAT